MGMNKKIEVGDGDSANYHKFFDGVVNTTKKL